MQFLGRFMDCILKILGHVQFLILAGDYSIIGKSCQNRKQEESALASSAKVGVPGEKK